MTDDTSKTIPADEGGEPIAAAALATRATQGPRGGQSGGAGRKAPEATKKPTRAATKVSGAGKAKPAKGAGKKTTRAAGEGRKPRTGTKQERLIAMLRRPEGITVDEIARAFGWQPHTVRGALYGALKKKLGLNITSEKVEGRGRVYRTGS